MISFSPGQPKQRILLLIPTTSYRTQAFLDAARRLGAEITVGSEHPNIFARNNPQGLLTLHFRNPDNALQEVTEFSEDYPINAVVGVDDQTTLLAATISTALGLKVNSVDAVTAARNKYEMRKLLRQADILQPHHALFSIDDNPAAVVNRIPFPCVVKPLMLAGSRGVIRANNEEEFVAAFRRVETILRTPDVACEKEASSILVEHYIPGKEVAFEGLLLDGKIKQLAIFDKPDPLEGPFFEETIYVTPSALPFDAQRDIALSTQRAVKALGLQHGPVHAEFRINREGSWIIEIAARSIGGFCSRALRFSRLDNGSETISLEELLLRDALGMDVEMFQREPQSSGVMMIPIPRAGILQEVKGLMEAKAVPDIEDIILSTHVGETMVPLPEGSKYVGFIFARAESPDRVESALREAHRHLDFIISSSKMYGSKVIASEAPKGQEKHL